MERKILTVFLICCCLCSAYGTNITGLNCASQSCSQGQFLMVNGASISQTGSAQLSISSGASFRLNTASSGVVMSDESDIDVKENHRFDVNNGRVNMKANSKLVGVPYGLFTVDIEKAGFDLTMASDSSIGPATSDTTKGSQAQFFVRTPVYLGPGSVIGLAHQASASFSPNPSQTAGFDRIEIDSGSNVQIGNQGRFSVSYPFRLNGTSVTIGVQSALITSTTSETALNGVTIDIQANSMIRNYGSFTGVSRGQLTLGRMAELQVVQGAALVIGDAGKEVPRATGLNRRLTELPRNIGMQRNVHIGDNCQMIVENQVSVPADSNVFINAYSTATIADMFNMGHQSVFELDMISVLNVKAPISIGDSVQVSILLKSQLDVNGPVTFEPTSRVTVEKYSHLVLDGASHDFGAGSSVKLFENSKAKIQGSLVVSPNTSMNLRTLGLVAVESGAHLTLISGSSLTVENMSILRIEPKMSCIVQAPNVVINDSANWTISVNSPRPDGIVCFLLPN